MSHRYDHKHHLQSQQSKSKIPFQTANRLDLSKWESIAKLCVNLENDLLDIGDYDQHRQDMRQLL